MDRIVHRALKSGALTACIILSLAASAAGLMPHQAPGTTLLFGGDVMLGRSVAQHQTPGSWPQVLSNLEGYTRSADLFFVNLESPLTDSPQVVEGMDLRAPPQSISALQAAGIDLVSLANNHAADAGQPGLAQSRQALVRAGILALEPEQESLHITINGIRLAWLAYDDILEPLDLVQAAAAVRRAQQDADWVLVSIHWGSEGQATPNTRQREIAATLAAAGADLIIGHHPHVLQPVEQLWGAGRGRPTLVAYNLGNLLFDQPAPPNRRAGLLRVQLDAFSLQGICLIPTVQSAVDGQPTIAEGAPAQWALARTQLTICAQP